MGVVKLESTLTKQAPTKDMYLAFSNGQQLVANFD